MAYFSYHTLNEKLLEIIGNVVFPFYICKFVYISKEHEGFFKEPLSPRLHCALRSEQKQQHRTERRRAATQRGLDDNGSLRTAAALVEQGFKSVSPK